MRSRFTLVAGVLLLCLVSVGWTVRKLNLLARAGHVPISPSSGGGAGVSPSRSPDQPRLPEAVPTQVLAHNLELRKGPDFRVYVPWLRGRMVRTHRETNPSFDDPDSFVLDVESGIIRANVGDLARYVNGSGSSRSPLKNITVTGDGDRIDIRGTAHKLVPVPVELKGTIAPGPERDLQIHVDKLTVLRIPLKGFLGTFKLTLADLFDARNNPGIRVSGNNIFLDPQQLLPPPHLRGQFSGVHVHNPDLEVTYGDARNAAAKVEQWRNFLRLSDGSIDFGKLTMHHVDLIMIDTSNDEWFDLDLNHYQEQLVNGYTRMTPQAGLEIFMPDLGKLPHNRATQHIGIEWMKNRNIPPPADVVEK